MYDGGHGGDRTVEIMLRQGCVRGRFEKEYELNFGTTSSGLGKVYLETTEATSGYEGYLNNYDRYYHDDFRLFNPCSIAGISCNVGRDYVTPLTDCTNVPGDWFSSYGSKLSPNVDVNVYYIGRNGGYANTQQLVLQNQAMVDYGSKQYIVLGFHEPASRLKTARNVDETYVSRMESAFGNHFLNLNKEIRLRAAELTYLVGVYDKIYGYYLDEGADDRAFVSKGDIPKSFYLSDLFHPNQEYGCKAFAILIHDKMVKLGYLDDKYILSTGSDL